MGRSQILRLLESKGDFTIQKLHSRPVQEMEEGKPTSKSMPAKESTSSGEEKAKEGEANLDDVVVEMKVDSKPKDEST